MGFFRIAKVRHLATVMMFKTVAVIMRDQILVRFHPIAEVSHLASFVMFKKCCDRAARRL